MSRPTAKRLNAKRLARKRKPRRARGNDGWMSNVFLPACVPAALFPTMNPRLA